MGMIARNGYELKMVIDSVNLYRRSNTYDPAKYRFLTNLKLETFNSNARSKLIYNNLAKAFKEYDSVLMAWLNPSLSIPYMIGKAVTTKACIQTYKEFERLRKIQVVVHSEDGIDQYEAEKKAEPEYGSLLFAFWLVENDWAVDGWLQKYSDIENADFVTKDWVGRINKDFCIANHCLGNAYE